MLGPAGHLLPSTCRTPHHHCHHVLRTQGCSPHASRRLVSGFTLIDASLGQMRRSHMDQANVMHPAGPGPAACAPEIRYVFLRLWTLETERLSTCPSPSLHGIPGPCPEVFKLQTSLPGPRACKGLSSEWLCCVLCPKTSQS